MKTLAASLLQRNALVFFIFLVLLTILRLTPHTLVSSPIIILVVFCGSLIWVNLILVKRGHPFMSVFLSLLLIPIMGIPIGLCSSLISRQLEEWRYERHGIQLVQGCNLAAANTAEFDIYALNNRLSELTNSPVANSNKISLIQNVLPQAQERARILDEDCAWRGHRDSHPWKTNWIAIKQALAASEE